MRKLNFTLIELMVVVATLAILLSLVQPSLNGILSSSKNLICQNQLKQIGTGTSLYTQDHDGFLTISHKLSSDPAWPTELSEYLDLYLNPYTNLVLIGTSLECPVHDFAGKNLNPKYGGYAFNHEYLGWTDVPRLVTNKPNFQRQKIHNISTPSQTIFMGDGINASQLNGGFDYYLKYLYKPATSNRLDFFYDRHNGLSNVLWADFSVKLEDWYDIKQGNSSDLDYFFKKDKSQ